MGRTTSRSSPAPLIEDTSYRQPAPGRRVRTSRPAGPHLPAAFNAARSEVGRSGPFLVSGGYGGRDTVGNTALACRRPGRVAYGVGDVASYRMASRITHGGDPCGSHSRCSCRDAVCWAATGGRCDVRSTGEVSSVVAGDHRGRCALELPVPVPRTAAATGVGRKARRTATQCVRAPRWPAARRRC
jgi:hypothetical protein